MSNCCRELADTYILLLVKVNWVMTAITLGSFGRVNTRETTGPDGSPGRVRQACTDQSAGALTVIFCLSLCLPFLLASRSRPLCLFLSITRQLVLMTVDLQHSPASNASALRSTCSWCRWVLQVSSYCTMLPAYAYHYNTALLITLTSRRWRPMWECCV